MQKYSILLKVILIYLAFSLSSQAANITSHDITYTFPENIKNSGDYYSSVLNLSSTLDISNTANQSWAVEGCLENPANSFIMNWKRAIGSSDDSKLTSGLDNILISNYICPNKFQLFNGVGDISSIPLEITINNLDIQAGNGRKNFAIQYFVSIQQ